MERHGQPLATVSQPKGVCQRTYSAWENSPGALWDVAVLQVRKQYQIADYGKGQTGGRKYDKKQECGRGKSSLSRPFCRQALVNVIWQIEFPS